MIPVPYSRDRDAAAGADRAHHVDHLDAGLDDLVGRAAVGCGRVQK